MEKFELSVRYTMHNSDICCVGVMLGYEWNDVCNYISSVGLYGEDGAGYCTTGRGEKFGHEQIDAIFEKIFNDNPSADEIYILD